MARPEQSRIQEAAFVESCGGEELMRRLPMEWPTPASTPPSPKNKYRSGYEYLGWGELKDPPGWADFDDFDVLLRLVDFSGLRDVLAKRLGWSTAVGQVPFDPVSLFLLMAWQLVQGWSRAATLRNLQKRRYADYARLFGFRSGDYPTEGGLRHFLTALGAHSENPDQCVAVQQDEGVREIAVQQLNQLIAQSVALVRASGVLSENSSRKALVCPDGQIHAAASRMRCQAVTASCYQAAPRPCPAQEQGQRGCDCAGPGCAQVCRRAAAQDPQARFVWYCGDNQAEPEGEKKGEGYFGYRSLPLQWVDPERRFSLTLLDDVRPANQREEVPASALLLQLADYYPDLQVDAVVGDAGMGYGVFLQTVYRHLGARRVVALRQHASDEKQSDWVLRGYTDQGRPICPYGYELVFNGYDYRRQRSKWMCQQKCRQGSPPQVCLPQVTYPPPDCPYQRPEQPHGRIVNLGERFRDGSLRLVRDLPVGGPTWKALYHRARNAVEGRNATLEDWGLKRLPVYGLLRAKALLFLADVVNNLTTLARLLRQATLAQVDP